MLTELGLSPDDETAYLTLLSEHHLTRSQLASALRWSRTRVDRALGSLVDRALVSTSTDNPRRFAAIAPDVALESLCQQRIENARQVRQAIPQLMKQFWAAQRDAVNVEFIEIVYSREGVQRIHQLQQAATRSVRGVDRPPYSSNPAVINTAELARIPEGVVYRAIYDQSVVELPERWPDIEASIAAGEQARVFSDIPFKVTLYDDWGATMPVVDETGEIAAFMIVHRSPLLDALSALFEAYWERSVPLSPGPSEQSRQERLVTLLSAGMSDAAIRRNLGVSASTVQREVRELMARLGVATRFQAGIQIGRRAAAEPGHR